MSVFTIIFDKLYALLQNRKNELLKKTTLQAFEQ